MQPLGLRQADLDGLARRYLDLYSRAQTKVELYDEWADRHGFLTASGKSPPWIKEYYAAVNSARLALRELERHLREQAKLSPLAVLEAQAQRLQARS